MKTERQLTSPYLLVFYLIALAMTSSALGLGAALAVLLLDLTAGRVREATAGWMVLFASAGCCVGAVLWALAWLCRRRHADSLSQRQAARLLEALAGRWSVRTAPSASEAQGQADQPSPVEVPDELLREMRELNVNLLLSPDQRRAKHEHLMARRAQGLAAAATRAVEDENLAEAQRQFDRLMDLAPDHPRVGPLRQRVEDLRRQVEARDIADATARAEELMAAGQYVQADAAARELAARHPDADGARELIRRVLREAKAFQAEHRRRMFAKVEKEASGRRWRAAMVAAEELLVTYPESPEAREVRAKLSTIADNAHIEEARELRDGISDLLSRRRFNEAIEKARDLIARFPDTTAAAELNKQMDRLTKLAAEEAQPAEDTPGG
ncbi:MAG: hypothetical protein ACYS5V_13265 [Planctomycetota bacterium]|jgi:outer membrane protein assembly factor BamD (BamD/ComL family)